VDVAAPGTSVKLNGALVAGGNVEYFKFSPDGTQVVYHADQDTDDVLELYLVDVATPGVSIKLSDTLIAGGNTSFDFVFSPHGTRLIYSADQDTDEVRELYLVDTAAPGTSMKVNESFVAGGQLAFIFAVSPDGAQIVYGAEQDTDDVRELYLVDSATPGASIKLSAPLVAGGNAGGFLFSPDGTQVVYFADQDTDGVGELYLVDTAAPGVSTKLNGEIAAGAEGAHNLLFLP
jgi:Tol biopolymer transport system component